MAQIRKMEVQVDIKSSAERFFQTYCNKQLLFPKMSPAIVKDMQLIKGSDFKSVGSIMKWTFVPTGNSSDEVSTTVTEGVDEKNNVASWSILDGDVKKLYSNIRHTLQITNATERSGALLKWTIEYEKQNADVPEPVMYCETASAFFKSIDLYLVNNP